MCISFLSSQKNKHHLQFLFSAQCNTDVVRAYLRPERRDRKRYEDRQRERKKERERERALNGKQVYKNKYKISFFFAMTVFWQTSVGSVFIFEEVKPQTERKQKQK